MKLERVIIGLLILVCVWLAFHKVPKNGIDVKYITNVEQRIDTLIKDTIVFKTKIKRYKDTIIVFRDSVREAKENKDTIKIIAFQDSLIFQQDYTIKWQDTLIDQLDTIIMYQNRVTDKLKDSVIDLNKDIKKAKRKRIGIFAAIGILTTLNLIK
jgi:hypothetical protein